MLSETYEEEGMKKLLVFKCHKPFKLVRENVEDCERSGRPTSQNWWKFWKSAVSDTFR